jgi:hypothetical protein
MLDDLARHSPDVDALRDRLPYVLDLLSGVTGVIDAESRGHRSMVFSTWWHTVDRSAQEAIQEMRNAELKRLESRTTVSTTTKTAVRGRRRPRPRPPGCPGGDPYLEVFRTVIDALREQPVSVVATVGRRNDPAALGPQPANVAVHQYIPQATLLPRCQVAVIHGGAGTMLGALATGLPLLFLPQGADQYSNADRVVAAGAGRKLLRNEVTAPAVREAMAALLGEPGYRLAAERIAAEITAMAPPAQALAAITASML